jgi:hypothetical protein
MNPLSQSIVPENIQGKPCDIEQSFISGSREEDVHIFSIAAQRMLDVNSWRRIGSSVSAKFDLTDVHVQKMDRAAALGDFIKIDILGPGSLAGDGYDWVCIEALEDNRNPNAEVESLAMRVRPCREPGKDTKEVAHFFTGEATSAFVVERRENKLTSFYHGRNEELNTGAEKMLDRVRNVIMGGTALAGVPEIQWYTLIKSFLKTEN